MVRAGMAWSGRSRAKRHRATGLVIPQRGRCGKAALSHWKCDPDGAILPDDVTEGAMSVGVQMTIDERRKGLHLMQRRTLQADPWEQERLLIDPQSRRWRSMLRLPQQLRRQPTVLLYELPWVYPELVYRAEMTITVAHSVSVLPSGVACMGRCAIRGVPHRCRCTYRDMRSIPFGMYACFRCRCRWSAGQADERTASAHDDRSLWLSPPASTFGPPSDMMP